MNKSLKSAFSKEEETGGCPLKVKSREEETGNTPLKMEDTLGSPLSMKPREPLIEDKGVAPLSMKPRVPNPLKM